MWSTSVCRVEVDGGGLRLKSCMISSTELHCKFQRSVIPPNYSTTDSDCRGAISAHSGLKKQTVLFSQNRFSMREASEPHTQGVWGERISPQFMFAFVPGLLFDHSLVLDQHGKIQAVLLSTVLLTFSSHNFRNSVASMPCNG